MARPVGMREAYELSSYLRSLSSRLGTAKNTALESQKRIEKDGRIVNSKKEEITRSVGEIKKQISSLKEEMRSLQKATLKIITDLKTSVKVEEMERLKKRIDAWGPEALVSRDEARRVVNKL